MDADKPRVNSRGAMHRVLQSLKAVRLKTPVIWNGKTMRLAVVGLGVVGQAQAFLAHKLGYTVYGYDIVKKDLPDYIIMPKSYRRDVGMTFICTVEQAVPSVLGELVDAGVGGVYVIKSTVPPGTTVKLSKQFAVHLAHNPAFLRQSFALEDVMNPSRIVIGQCCEAHTRLLLKFYEPLKAQKTVTDPTTSELVKIVANSLRATAITFWNEIAELCERKGLSVEEVARVVDQSKTLAEYEGGRWGTSKFSVPYGEKCLPKDLNHLIVAFKDAGLDPLLFSAVRTYNDRLTKKETRPQSPQKVDRVRDGRE
jgi:nucleotide sugar dehydrogenase